MRRTCGADVARCGTRGEDASPRKRLRGADVAHGECVAGPREPTQMPGWHLRGMQSNRLASDGPTGIVDPC